jgi:hypothetical protein
VVERVRATAIGSEAIGVLQIADCLVRDSVVRAEGMEAVAVAASGTASTGTIRNVTAIAAGEGSTGISSHYFGPPSSPYILDVGSTIARGAGNDLRAEAGLPGAGDIVVSHSNFDHVERVGEATISDAGGNQTAAPLFVDAAAGDYREAAGSPTIDAGIADRSGPLDLAGNPRVLGATPDIGAFEFIPPVAKTAAGGGVRTIAIRPRRFAPWPSGGPVAPAILRSKPPKGAEVTYSMTGPATVTFSVSRKVRGRLAGKRCVRKTGADVDHRKCSFYVPVKGSFTQQGAAGDNHFIFSGRIGGKALKPGPYKLTALAGHLVSAPFETGGLKRRHRRRG